MQRTIAAGEGSVVRVTVKNTCCPLCVGNLVVDDCDLSMIDSWHEETMVLIQPVIDWQNTLVGDRQ